jgi:Flp pilus assembly pilin Flp
MDKLMTRIRSLARSEEGQDLVEYAMLVSLIALLSVVAVTAAGGQVQNIFNAVVAAIPA